MTKARRELYRQEDLPIFQNRMYDTPEAGINCPKGQMLLVQDGVTGLVFNAAFDPKLLEYDARYQNEQGNSPRFRIHMEDVADIVLSYMGSDQIIEVGCGKGLFLEILATKGVEATGFDPAYEGDNPRIQRMYFSKQLGRQANGIILRHVLEHIENPVDFLHRLSNANECKGLIYIEVPCFDWILDNKAWFDIFYEHVNYFRLSDFGRIFEDVLYADRGFGGQYLRVVADLSSLREPICSNTDIVEFPADFLDSLKCAKDNSNAAIIWGGASKGVIYSLFLEREGIPIERVIDINPAKQGRFLPGSGLRVLSPDEGLADVPDGTVIHVMNPNYLEEIRRMAGSRFQFKVA